MSPTIRPCLLLLVSGLGAALGAQSAVQLRPASGAGTWFALDKQSPVTQTLTPQAGVTTAVPQRLVSERKENGQEVAYLRTKTSLRQPEDLPAVRIHFDARLAQLSQARSRELGTWDGSQPGPQRWDLDYSAAPGTRLRIHLRWRSTLQGVQAPTSIQGRVGVDIGRDGSQELSQPLDGRRHLGDHNLVVGTSGQLSLAVLMDLRLTSSGQAAASAQGTLDVLVEPVQDYVAGLLPYGLPCGPKQFGVTWVDAQQQRRLRLILEGAPPSAPALLALGDTELEVPLAGFNCPLRVLPKLLVPAQTNVLGRAVMDFPAFPDRIGFTLRLQFGILGSGAQDLLSEALHFRGRVLGNAVFEPAEINHVLGTGQSLSIGGLGGPALSTTAHPVHWMFQNGLLGGDLKVTGLRESVWETMSTGMVEVANSLWRSGFNRTSATRPTQDHRILVSLHGSGGLPYDLLKKGSQNFAQGAAQLALGQLGAWQRQQTYIPRCVTNVHGETDHTQVNPSYDQDMIDWQRDYEAMIHARGFTHPVPMLHSQMSSYTNYNTSWSFIPPAQLSASVRYPRKLPLVGPKYMLSYLDGVHLTNQGYRHMGEYYGKVYNHVILEGATWEPLRPLAISREGARILVRFHVPEPPLALDTGRVTDPGNYGFEYTDTSGSPPSIQAVKLIDADSVEILLSAAPSATAAKWLRYAHTGVAGNPAGPKSGARGCLRDSDPTPSLYGNELFNWAVHFNEPIQ